MTHISEGFCKELKKTINFNSVLPLFFQANGVVPKENFLVNFKKVLSDFNYKISQLDVMAKKEARRHTVTVLNQVLKYCQKQGLPFLVVKAIGYKLYGFSLDVDLRKKYLAEDQRRVNSRSLNHKKRRTLLLK